MNHQHKEAYLRLQGYEPMRWSYCWVDEVGPIRVHSFGWYNRQNDHGLLVWYKHEGKRGGQIYGVGHASGDIANGWEFTPWTHSYRITNAIYRELIAWENMDDS